MSRKNYIICMLAALLSSCASTSPAPIVFKGDDYYGKDMAYRTPAYSEETVDDLNEGSIVSKSMSSKRVPNSVIVQDEESLSEIAHKYHITEESLIRENNLAEPVYLEPGQVLKLPPILFHEVQEGETLQQIADHYGVSKQVLIEKNKLSAPYEVTPGQILIIGDKKQIKDNFISDDAVIDHDMELENNDSLTSKGGPIVLTEASKKFIMPSDGKIVQHFGKGEKGVNNEGIIIEQKLGSPVKAVSDGKVIYSGTELEGYGNLIIIRHNGGVLSAYAHMEDRILQKGDSVFQGEIIGHVGKTGKASSPQLYFAVREGEKAVDPLKYLPKRF